MEIKSHRYLALVLSLSALPTVATAASSSSNETTPAAYKEAISLISNYQAHREVNKPILFKKVIGLYKSDLPEMYSDFYQSANEMDRLLTHSNKFYKEKNCARSKSTAFMEIKTSLVEKHDSLVCKNIPASLKNAVGSLKTSINKNIFPALEVFLSQSDTLLKRYNLSVNKQDLKLAITDFKTDVAAYAAIEKAIDKKDYEKASQLSKSFITKIKVAL